jgi:hypothetical protein
MNPGIFLIQPNGDLVEMNETPYDSEDLLQMLLAKYPSLLAGNQIDPRAPRKWLFIERETAIPSMEGGSGRWSADHLFLDQDAVPTIVEVKRSSFSTVRISVVVMELQQIIRIASSFVATMSRTISTDTSKLEVGGSITSHVRISFRIQKYLRWFRCCTAVHREQLR